MKKISAFKNWFDGDTEANLSIGQGRFSHPLQVVRMMAALPITGYLVTPYVTKSIDGKNLSRYHKSPRSLILSQETLSLIREGLMSAVGARVVRQMFYLQWGYLSPVKPEQPRLLQNNHAWFSGFFPYKEPKFVMVVFLENGRPGYYSCVITKTDNRGR